MWRALTVKGVWKRIHQWLRENAPAGYGHLQPGASVEEIKAAEAAIGVKLPADVRESYRIHNGQANEPGQIGGEGWRLLSIREMVEQWDRWSQANPKNAHFVPVAWIGTGDYVLLNFDARAKEPGSVMIQRCDSPNPDPLARSFSSWLEEFADQLEDGELAYSEESGEIMYADELDLD
jgi:cell wall assembly regulator SMI1